MRKLVPGVASHSYGLNVAAIAGLPRNVITRTKEVLNSLHVQDNKTPPQQELFESKNYDASLLKIRNELDNLDVDDLSPKEALNMLYSLKEKI